MTVTISNDNMLPADGFIQPLLDYVTSATGLMFYADRPREFATHVASRLEALKIDHCLSYLQLLQNGQSGKAELDRLIELLTIGETHFFRHRELFQALENTVLPHLLEKNKRQRRLRIWSAGCSIGAEAYSISMLLRRRFAAHLAHWNIEIVGTDINRDYLARASAGRFEDWALRTVSAEDREAYFSHDGRSWAVKPPFQQGVSFEHHNLASSPFSSPLSDPSGYDLILCRNVMIYFSQDVVRQCIRNLHDCLANDGWLVVGHAEHNVNWFGSFRTVMTDGAVLYQKQAAQQIGAEVSADSELCPPVDDLSARDESHRCELAEKTAAPPRHQADRPDADLDACQTEATRDKHHTLQAVRGLADRGELQEAMHLCRALQESDPLDPSPHFFQALILQQCENEVGTEQSLRRAIYLDRHYLLAHYYLGLLLQKQRQMARAARSFQNVIKLSTGRPPGEQIADADELTIVDLQRLSVAHLSVMEQT